MIILRPAVSIVHKDTLVIHSLKKGVVYTIVTESIVCMSACIYSLNRDLTVTECIVCVSGYDPLTFSSCRPFLFDWVGVLWPQLSEVLKLVCWARCILFPQVYLQKQVAF